MEKNFDEWNNHKKSIHSKVFTGFVHEREIWWCSLGLNIGFEEDGKNHLFERPVLVIKKFNRSVVLVVPLTSQVKDSPYYYSIEYDKQKFSIIVSQIRLISTSRLTRRIRKIDERLFEDVVKTIKELCL